VEEAGRLIGYNAGMGEIRNYIIIFAAIIACAAYFTRMGMQSRKNGERRLAWLLFALAFVILAVPTAVVILRIIFAPHLI
jgi:hypothetical protein